MNQDDYLCYSDVTNTTSEYDSSDDDSDDSFDIPEPVIGRTEKQQYEIYDPRLKRYVSCSMLYSPKMLNLLYIRRVRARDAPTL